MVAVRDWAVVMLDADKLMDIVGAGRALTVTGAVPEAVVYASITILISNFFLTLTLNQLFHLYD